jgi:hypothetical protein
MTPTLRARALAPAQLVAVLLVMGLARGDEPPAPRPPATSGDSANVRAAAETSTYSDSDHVFVVSPTMALSVEDPVHGWSASGRYLVDVVSAASADIVSTATARWHEVRHVGSIEGSYKPYNFGIAPRLSISREPDYLSLGAGLTLSTELDDKAWTLALGYGYGHDTMSVRSTPFSVYSESLDRHGLNASASAVIDRATRITFIGDAVLERGYLAKPYRYVPTFEGNLPAKGAPVETVNELRSPERVAEHVPDARNRFALTTRLSHRFRGKTLRLDERLYADSWGMLASTTDARLMSDLSPRFMVWPHLRGHVQQGVSFWQRTYQITTDAGNVRHVPTWISGNREFGPMKALTLGGGASWGIGPDEDVSRRKLTFVLDGVGTWYSESLFLQHRYGIFSAVTFEMTFE